MASAAGEGRVALLDERGHAFLLVRAREELGKLLRLAAQVLAVVALERLVQRSLRGRERERAFLRQLTRKLRDALEQLLRLVERSDQADSQGLLGVDHAAAED